MNKYYVCPSWKRVIIGAFVGALVGRFIVTPLCDKLGID